MKGMILLIILLILQVSCGSKHELKIKNDNGVSDGLNMEGDGEDGAVDISFLEIKETILDPSCVSCHSSYASYEEVKRDSERILAAVLANRMPKFAAPLSEDLKELLNDWVEGGAPQFINE